MKLNLGCGFWKLDGYVNVDIAPACEPDEAVDLERFPWPWPDDSVEAVEMSHVLEHLGATTEVYFGVLKELYRICRHDARVRIVVPHPRHDDFLNDPTHVRPVTIEGLAMLSRRKCEEWVREKAANTPLALMLDVDFEIEDMKLTLEQPWRAKVETGAIGDTELLMAMRQHNNVVKETTVVLRVVKGRGES